MPVLTEEKATADRKRRGARGLWLLLVPPVLLLGLFVAALVRPIELQLGPVVVLALSAPVPVKVPFKAYGQHLAPGRHIPVERHSYKVTGSGWGGTLLVAGRVFAFGWFRGHRN